MIKQLQLAKLNSNYDGPEVFVHPHIDLSGSLVTSYSILNNIDKSVWISFKVHVIKRRRAFIEYAMSNKSCIDPGDSIRIPAINFPVYVDWGKGIHQA